MSSNRAISDQYGLEIAQSGHFRLLSRIPIPRHAYLTLLRGAQGRIDAVFYDMTYMFERPIIRLVPPTYWIAKSRAQGACTLDYICSASAAVDCCTQPGVVCWSGLCTLTPRCVVQAVPASRGVSVVGHGPSGSVLAGVGDEWRQMWRIQRRDGRRRQNVQFVRASLVAM